MERRTHARERRHNVIVGITALAGLIGLVLLLTAFGYIPALLRTGYTVTLYMDNVAGLHENSPVTLWGRDIGEVQSLGFSEPGESHRAYAKLLINRSFQIPEDVDVRVETPLFGGGPVIALIGSEPGAQTLPMDGTGKLSAAKVVDPLRQLEVLSDDIAELKATWTQVGQNINTLFGSEGEGSPSLPRVVMGIEKRLDDLGRVFAEAESWLGDEKLREDVSQTAANARAISEALAEAVENLEKRYVALADSAEAQLKKVDQTLDSAAKSVGEIETRYVALADDAAKVVSVIDKLVARADSKDSTIGLLLSDPQMYHNLNDTSERLKLMVDEARLLIEKWKAEGVPIRVFN